jgi:hypothetical protein
MKHLIASALLAGVVAMLPHPVPADAREKDKLDKCLFEAVQSCDRDFQGNDIYTVAARGYCYMIRTAMCHVLDRE